MIKKIIFQNQSGILTEIKYINTNNIVLELPDTCAQEVGYKALIHFNKTSRYLIIDADEVMRLINSKEDTITLRMRG